MGRKEVADAGQADFLLDRNPIIVRDGLYSREQILSLMRITSATLGAWQKSGLSSLQKGTKKMYFYGGDLIDFLRRED